VKNKRRNWATEKELVRIIPPMAAVVYIIILFNGHNAWSAIGQSLTVMGAFALMASVGYLIIGIKGRRKD